MDHHSHQCVSCRRVWAHSDNCVGRADLHVCPSCSTPLPRPWFKYFGEAQPHGWQCDDGRYFPMTIHYDQAA